VQQSVEQIVGDLPANAVKFLTTKGDSSKIYPCNAVEKNIFFVRSSTAKDFFPDIAAVRRLCFLFDSPLARWTDHDWYSGRARQST
jgi:hypothetical protein